MIKRFMTIVGDDECRCRNILHLLQEEFKKGNDPAIGMTYDADVKIFIMEVDDSTEKMRIIFKSTWVRLKNCSGRFPAED